MGREPRKAHIKLDNEQAQDLKGDWNGSGGFQTLGPKLAARLSPSNEIELDDEEVGVIVRHMSYVPSGFRGRVQKIFRDGITALMNVK